jgi:hypothetical protein
MYLMAELLLGSGTPWAAEGTIPLPVTILLATAAVAPVCKNSRRVNLPIIIIASYLLLDTLSPRFPGTRDELT